MPCTASKNLILHWLHMSYGSLKLLNLEWPKLNGVLAILSVRGFICWHVLFKDFIFLQIGFLSYHRNLLKQYLVCLHCNLCPVAQYNVKDYLRKFCSLKMAEMEFTKLEVVPVSFLIDGRLSRKKDSNFVD